MSISKQIIYSSSLVALLALFGGYVSHRNMQAMQTSVDQCMGNAVGMTNSLRGVQENIVGIHQWLFKPGEEEEFLMQMEVFEDNIKDLSILGNELTNGFKKVHQGYFALNKKLPADSNNLFFDELRANTFHGERLIRQAQVANSKLIYIQNEKLKTKMSNLNYWLVLICVSVFFMAGIFGQLIARALNRTLLNLEHSAAEILKGNFSSRVKIEANNEFGYLSDSFNLLASSAESGKLIQDQKNELVRLNTQLKLKNDSLDSFVYRVSHDLKAPIINLISLQKVLGKKVENVEDTSILKSLEFMTKNTDKLQRTIHDLLEVSRIERSINTAEEAVNILELLEEVKEENAESIVKETATFELDLAVINLHFSKANIKSIFANLITNSIKYRKPDKNPKILIASKKVNSTVVLKFQDNGIGIDLAKHGHKLFGIFNRFHNHVEGSGVGLYIVKKVVEESGGSISIDSEVGIGTTFTITLPHNFKEDEVKENELQQA